MIWILPNSDHIINFSTAYATNPTICKHHKSFTKSFIVICGQYSNIVHCHFVFFVFANRTTEFSNPDDPNWEPSCIGNNQSPPYVLAVGQLFKTHDKTRVAYIYDMFRCENGTTKVISGVLSQQRMVCAKQGIYSPVILEAVGIFRKKDRIWNSRCSCDAIYIWFLVMF